MQMRLYRQRIKRSVFVPVLGMMAVFFVSCKKETDIVSLEPSVAWQFYRDTSMTVYVDFLRSDQLLPLLNDIGKKYTIFAPPNTAFNTFLTDTLSHEGFSSFAELNSFEQSLVQSIANYHVIEGSKFISTDIPVSDSIATRKGVKIKVEKVGTNLLLNSTARVTEERTVPSGNMFVIDKVLIPPNINLKSIRQTIRTNPATTTFAAALDRLSALANTPTTAGPTQAQQKIDSASALAIINQLNGRTTTRTVFVPSNKAFEEFFATYPVHGDINTITPARLINLVNNHTLNGTIKRLVSSTVTTITFTGANEAVVYRINASTQNTIPVIKSPFKFGTANADLVENLTYRGVYYIIDKVQTINSTGY